jgi:hypothetical protein
MPRRVINLHRLPSWLQYAIALVVVVFVVGAAWLSGHHP